MSAKGGETEDGLVADEEPQEPKKGPKEKNGGLRAKWDEVKGGGGRDGQLIQQQERRSG